MNPPVFKGISGMKRVTIGVSLLFGAASLFAAELAVDTTIRPGDDFFKYANGPWLKSTEIPPDRSSMGDDVVLAELNNQRTLEIFKAARASAAGTEGRKLADFYDAFMDEAAIQKNGLKPLEPQLKAIAAIKDRKELSRLLGAQLRVDMDVLNATSLYTNNLLGLWIAQD